MVTWTLDAVGDLLHLEGLDRLGPLVEEVLLVGDDRLGDLEQGAPALLDRLDQPAGRLDLLLDELAGDRVGLLVLEHPLILSRDRQLRRVVVGQPDLVLSVLVGLDDEVGHDILRAVRRGVPGARAGVEAAELLDRILDVVDRDPGPLLDRRQAVLLDVVEVVGDQDLEDVAAGDVGRELQEQALAEVPRPDARRVELLDHVERLLGLREGDIAAVVADEVAELEVEEAVVVEVVDQVLGEGP